MNIKTREQKIRERNILARAGKALIFDEPKILDLIRKNKIPTQMQHCIIKVSKKMQGTDKERFISAVNICQAVFQNHGYQYAGDTKLTSKGLQNNLRHRRELGASQKGLIYRKMTELFDKEFKLIEREEQKQNQKDIEAFEKWREEQRMKKEQMNKQQTDEKSTTTNSTNKIVSTKSTRKK